MLGAWEQARLSLGKPDCGNPTHSPLPRPDHRMPETQLPPGGFVTVEPPSHPHWTPEFSRPAVTRSPLPRPRLAV